MLLVRKTRHTLRPIIGFIFFSLSIFLVIFAGGILLLWFSLTHPTILSPIGKTLLQQKPHTIEDEVIGEMVNRHIEYQSITTAGDTITIILPDGIQALLTSQKDISTQIASLQVATQNLTIEKKKPVKIDFRFDRVIYSF